MVEVRGWGFSTSASAQARKASGLAVAVGLVLVAAAARAASSTWSPEAMLATDLPFSESAVRVRSAVNTAGRAVVVWDNPLPAGGGIGFGNRFQTYAAVRSTATSPWSTATPLSADGATAQSAAAVVDGVGNVTAIWTSNGSSRAASSRDAGATWSQETIPGDAGFSAPPLGMADVDRVGNITVILLKQRPSTSTFDAEAVVRSVDGTWLPPVLLTGAEGVNVTGRPRLSVLRDGRAMASIGATTFWRTSSGRWGAPKNVDLAGLGVIDQSSADMDAGGKGYFVFRAVTSGVGGVFVSTSTSSSGWSAPRHVAMFDPIGTGLQVTGSSRGRAIISGSGAAGVLVSATSDGGSTWSAPTSLGFGFEPTAAGSENGFYALGWNSFGATGVALSVAAGGGPGRGAPSWVVTDLGDEVRSGSPSVAISGRAGTTSAKTVAGWERDGAATTGGRAVLSSTGTVSRR